MSRLAARAAAVVLVLAASALAGAQTQPTVRAERLDNGMTVLVRENPLAPVVAVSLMVAVGSRWETAANAGVSNFLDAVMVKGTTKRSGSELADMIASLGGKVSASGEVDYSEIRASALARFWKELLRLTAELALEPKLAAEEVDPERDFLLSRIQRRRDNVAARAFDELYAALYGAHPYALSTLGTPESLARIDHAAIVAHYRTFYRPERMVLAVSGQVSASAVVAEARRLFGALPGGPRPPEPSVPAPPVPTARRIDIVQSAQQVQILVGGLAPSLDDADHAPVKVLSTVLGGGMAGRLFAELRDKQALAYSATSYYDAVRGPGALVLYLGTAPENASRAETALRAEVDRVKNEPVGDEELRRAKGYLLGRYAMDRRTNDRQAWYLAFYETALVGGEYPERYRRAVEGVKAADVQRVARRYLAAPTTVVLHPPESR